MSSFWDFNDILVFILYILWIIIFKSSCLKKYKTDIVKYFHKL